MVIYSKFYKEYLLVVSCCYGASNSGVKISIPLELDIFPLFLNMSYW